LNRPQLPLLGLKSGQYCWVSVVPPQGSDNQTSSKMQRRNKLLAIAFEGMKEKPRLVATNHIRHELLMAKLMMLPMSEGSMLTWFRFREDS
jgi:hypothetical protein